MTQILIQTQVGTPKLPLRLFRSGDGFESLSAYIESDLIPFMLEHVKELSQIRCSLSGWLIGTYLPEEAEAVIRQGLIAVNFYRFSDIMVSFTRAGFVSAVEELIDHVSIRALILARPSPVIAGSKGKPAIASAPRNRQLCLLLNQLLWDAGQMRERHTDSFDTIARLRKIARVADQVRDGWDGLLATATEVEANQFEDLYSGLVELDAKWQMANLQFTEAEMNALKKHRESDVLDVPKLRAWVWSMITFRDKHVELKLSESWTRRAYTEIAFNTFNSADPAKSNLRGDTGPSNRHIKHPVYAAEKPKKESKSKDVNRNMFSALLKETW